MTTTSGSSTTYDRLIGRTRLLVLDEIAQRFELPSTVTLLAKLEGDGPGGSVKDRAAWGMIRGALDRGEIRRGDRLVEATSGNTGIALAMVAGRFGLGMTLVVPASATAERVQAMKAFGAEVLRTAPEETMEHARVLAEQMGASGRYHILNQFSNPDNWRMHYNTTGPEIWQDTQGTVTHFVSAMGTTGTIMGTSRFLKEKSSRVQIVGTQPTDGSRIPGIRKWSPEMVPAFFEPARVDRIIEVSEAQAVRTTRILARSEGILAGMSTGGALFAALEVAADLTAGTVVFVVCDRGDRYLSSTLFGED